MKKIIIASVLALALPVLGMAATVTNVTFSNGDVTISAPVNSTVTGKLHTIVPPNEVGQWLGVKVDGLAEQCTAISISEGTTDVPFSVLNAPNTGTYNFTYRIAGRWGGIPSVDCNDNVIVGNTVGSAVKATASGSTVVGGSTNLEALIAALIAKIGAANPAPSSSCTTLNLKMVGTSAGVYSPANVQLQGYLLSEGESIPALTAGASFGFFGTQTQGAVSHFRVVHGCM